MMASVTAPWRAEWAPLLSDAVSIITRVEAHIPVGDPITLEVVSGTVSYNEDRAPMIEANLDVRLPDDQAILDALDARQAVRIKVFAGYGAAGQSDDVQMLADLMLYERTVLRPDNVMRLLAVSDERRVQEAIYLQSGLGWTETATAGGAIAYLLQQAIPGVSLQATPSVNVPFVDAGGFYPIDFGAALWTTVQDIADRVGAWVYHDGLGRFWMVAQPVDAGAAVASYKVGPGGTITASETSLSRDEFVNTVLVTFQWYTGEQQTASGYAQVTSGPYSVAAIGNKGKHVTIERRGSAAQARASAASMVTRGVTRGRSMSVEMEHATFWVRPGKTVTVQLPTGPQERHFVSRVDFDLPGGTMHVTTRQPQNVTITTGE